jgi:gamma-glutamyltranspeptidase/glutathione hydrolase
MRGVIAAGHPKTAEAGQIVFALGGNAFDAAIAAVLTAFVVESTLTSPGGGGFLLAHTQDNKNYLFDFFCQTPRSKKLSREVDFYPVAINFGGEVQAFHIGLGSIATPGNLAGVFLAHQKLGRLPFSVVAEPAIHCAENGFILSQFNTFTWQLLEPILLALPESRKIYASEGKLLAAGEICYLKDFANILREICQRGIDTFYRGEIAHQVARDLAKGGYLKLEDLTSYQVAIRQPLKIHYRGYELITNPPPSSGGALIAFALKLLEGCDFTNIEFGSQQHWEILARAMYLTNQARSGHYDTRLYQSNIIDDFLADNLIQDYQSQLTDCANKWGSTTHISVLDELGNAASITTSNGEGSSYVIPDTGIMLNNMLGEADLNPLGFHTWNCDCRISSMMSPTIVLKEGKPEIVLGSGGSNRIRTAILQVICNLLDFHLTLEKAVASSRIHWENNVFSVEPIPQPEILDRLNLPPSSKIVAWAELNMFFGGVHTVRNAGNGRLEGAGDPRRAGVVIVC